MSPFVHPSAAKSRQPLCPPNASGRNTRSPRPKPTSTRPHNWLAQIACWLLLACLGLSASLHADPFSEGIDAYQNSQYDTASEYFNTAIAESETAAARHNLALAYFHLGRPAEAAWQIERACRLDPMNAQYRYKLEALRQQLGLFQSEPRWFEIGAQALPANTWVILATLSFWLLLAGLSLARIRNRRNSLAIKALCAIATFVLLLALPAIWLNNTRLQDAIIVSPEPVSLHAAPASAEPQRGTARPGERARIIDQHLDFYEIVTESGASGWVASTALRPIEPPH